MLETLHVKNLALIDEVEIDFDKGLNILTGETGAGKSIIIGSINLCLGAKADKSLIRTGEEYALIELIFKVQEPVKERLKELEIIPEEDGTLILQRKITESKSSCKVNGEAVSVKQLRDLAPLLLDMHGQREHQTLLSTKKHKDILDSYCDTELKGLIEKQSEAYKAYKSVCAELLDISKDDNTKKRELDLLKYEINEIEAAKLEIGEDEELEALYRKMSNSKDILKAMQNIMQVADNDGNFSLSSGISIMQREINQVSGFDTEIEKMAETLGDLEGVFREFSHQVSSYADSLEFDEKTFFETQERLNTINCLKDKYGDSIEAVLEYYDKKVKEYEKLLNLEEHVATLENKKVMLENSMNKLCGDIHGVREKQALILQEELKKALISLNFDTVSFEIRVEANTEEVSSDGWDKVEFYISTNMGEPLKPLQDIASGGEMSRIMLALKTVLADSDEMDTLVFDEIDTGISGRTAYRVSEEMGKLSTRHQLLCITHLPQIAAMADAHFVIQKGLKDNRTTTSIERLDDSGSIAELARLLGSDELSEGALNNAKELKDKSNAFKKEF